MKETCSKLSLSVIIAVCLTAVFGLGEDPKPNQNDEQLRKIEDQLSEVRRDQLNYKIEKDLLKEAYSSNLQIVNAVIAIALGVFAVL